MKIEFCTNITTPENEREVIGSLRNYLPDSKATIDLSNSGKVLRIEAPFFRTADVIYCLYFLGYSCTEIKDR